MILATLERWQGVCKACGFECASRDYGRVIRGWSSWGRHYHTLGHLEACLKEFDQVRNLTVNAGEVELSPQTLCLRA
jgi:predicted metal-dependent HD superfamily phosphohydrolase